MLTKLGPFEVLEVIGRGGMGTVYRGIDPIIGRPVAIKVIRLLGYNDGEEQAWLKDRLFREARTAGSLRHPGIVTIYHVGEEQDVAYIAMEFVDGPTLHQILDQEPPRDSAMLCRILSETAAALDYAHARGLVHRDIKPANIMVNADGVTKVTDFGIAKTTIGQTATKTGMILGTPYYMSPEQIRGNTLDGRSDQFALAVVSYEIFTGRRPFQAEQPTSICYQIIHEEPMSPEDLNPALGAEVAEVIKKGLAKEPEGRYSTCTEFTAVLSTALSKAAYKASQVPPQPTIHLPPPTPRPPDSASESIPTHRPRYEKFRGSIWMVLSLVIVLTSIWILGSRSSQKTESPSEIVKKSSPATTQGSDEPRIEPAPTAAASPIAESKPAAKNLVANATNQTAVPREEPKTPAPVQPKPTEEPDAAPVKPPAVLKGTMVWTGQMIKGGLLTITGTRASIGSLSGALPGRPVKIHVYPAESGAAGLTVFTSDSRYAVARTRGTATYTFDPRHATDIAVFETPGPQNRWDRLVIRINNPKTTACVIEWETE
jgi:serine/threonine-protein kinase